MLRVECKVSCSESFVHIFSSIARKGSRLDEALWPWIV